MKTKSAIKKSTKAIDISQKIGIEMVYEVNVEDKPKIPNIHLHTFKGDCVFVCSEREDKKLTAKGKFKSVAWIPANFLNVEVYSVGLALSTMVPTKAHFWVKDALTFETNENINNRLNSYNQNIPGIIRPVLNWETENWV